jgi:hypothetical protein
MVPGLTIMEMIHEVEEHLRKKLDWWCDVIVINAIPNIVPVPKESEDKFLDSFSTEPMSNYEIADIFKESED